MLIELNQQNYFILDPTQGCRILQLTLKGKTIIKAIQNESFLGSGSYLMFPWVNRVLQNPYQSINKHPFEDGNGYPLHGLFMKSKREVKKNLIQENGFLKAIQLMAVNAQINPKMHGFEQKFTLTDSALEINFQVHPSQYDKNPFCFGYHPYFQLSKPIQELQILTNLQNQLQLQKDLIVKWPNKHLALIGDKLDSSKRYDSLFYGNEKEKITFLSLNDGVSKVRVESDLKYWQIYTPEDGRRIAVEPMSFHGNLYECIKQSPEIRQHLPTRGTITISVD